MKYPIGIQSFERIIEDGYVYIDKTDMIYSLTHGGSIYYTVLPTVAAFISLAVRGVSVKASLSPR